MRSVAVRAEQQIAAGQAELAAAQEHNQLLQEMLHDAQVRLPGLQTYLGCYLITRPPQVLHFYTISTVYCCYGCTAYHAVKC